MSRQGDRGFDSSEPSTSGYRKKPYSRSESVSNIRYHKEETITFLFKYYF